MHRRVLYLWYFFIVTINLAQPVLSDPVKVLANQSFTLRLGQQAKFEDILTILFKSVVKDSRCPVNVTCFWAGNGKIQLETLFADGSKTTILLNSEINPKKKTLKNFQLQLLELNPPKVNGVKIPTEDYSVTLKILTAQ